MIRRAILLLILPLLAAAMPAGAEEPSCVTHCHGKESTAHAASVHAGTLGCIDCHGGNPAAQRDKEKSHDPAAGFRGRVPRAEIPALCAKCHADPVRMHAFGLPTDQMAQYRSSGHGRALFERGDATVAVCTDCHGTHGILAAEDPQAPTARANQPETCGSCHADAERMAPSGLPADTVELFRSSVHGRALTADRRGAPACADCHGAHGATPPGVGEVEQVCGHCHLTTGEQYGKSPHHTSGEMACATCHDEPGYAYKRNGCTACHGVHGIREAGEEMYQGDDVGRCGHCHREDGPWQTNIAAVVVGRKRLIDAMAETRGEIRAAKDDGLFLDHESVYLLESERALVSLGPLAHSLDAAAVERHLKDGLNRQDRAREVIAKQGKVLRDRRLLLGGLAAILLLFAALIRAKLQAVRRLS